MTSPLDKAFAALKSAMQPQTTTAATTTATTSSSTASTSAADAAAEWKRHENTLEDALEFAGISGIDIQIDSSGFAKAFGTVNSEEDRQTIVAMLERSKVTGVDMQVNVVPAKVDETPVAVKEDAATEYTVKAGESWWGIAQRAYGNGNLWKALKAANNNPRMIHPGTVITLPPKSKLS